MAGTPRAPPTRRSSSKITLKDGTVRYRFVIDISRDPKSDKRRQLTKTYDTKKEARAEYAKIKHQTDEGTFVAPDKLTVSDWLDTWLKSATIDVEKATAANYADALLPVRERLGDRRLQQLDEEDIDSLVSWMLTSGRKRGGKVGTGLSARSVQLTLGRLRSALNVAVRRKLVARNVAQYTQIPREARRKAAEAKAKRVPWSADEVKTFVAATREHRLQAPMLLSLLGMRPAEVCGLRWSADVDLVAKTIRVENTRTLVEGEVEEKGPKSEKGKRTLPLPSPVVAALKSLKARQAQEKLVAGSVYLDSGYVLVDEQGAPWKTDKLRRETYKLMAAARVRKVRPYDARHSCLTYLATSGVPDVIVSAWAGHADLSFTKRVYIHPNAEHLKEAADQLDTLLG
ncbi:tyrosine-type recombinase/integrase [Amycolatopsis rhizosphaerae]|uniref:Tyrosine-type recombinase/integrase n=1 Tax=Amycolatopsis rhizosphaerae TaxID=2053003 RepID=A0A558CH61_9PSEU|nr:tyrosine-type recombinase/integrase [Amycolatopsis rhizosphaerae]